MASRPEYVQFVAEQLSEAGNITYRKMFGEYGLYCDGVYFGVVCDDRFLIKPVPAAKQLLPDAPMELPYEGAKPMVLVTELDDRAFLAELIRAVCAQLPKKKR